MRKRFGSLFRFIVESCTKPTEFVHPEYTVDAEELAVDVYFDRDLDPSDIDPRLGLLGRITAERSVLEAFHQAPSAEAICDCLVKQRVVHSLRRREARRGDAKSEDNDTPTMVVPWLWLVCGGDPENARKGLGFQPLAGWPTGVYEAPTDYRMRMVVISQLPANYQTLLVRLMGKDQTLEHAVMDLRTQYSASWEAELIFPWVQRLHLTFQQDPTQFDDEDREALMDIFEQTGKHRNELKAEGFTEGLQVGIEKGIEKGTLDADRYALRLVLSARDISLSALDGARIEACDDISTLQRWLQNAAVATTAAEAFASREPVA